LFLGQLALAVDGGEALVDRAGAGLGGFVGPDDRQLLAGLDCIPFADQQSSHSARTHGDDLGRRCLGDQDALGRLCARVTAKRNPKRQQRNHDYYGKRYKVRASRLGENDLTFNPTFP
jgi:hypothetical protein